MRQITVNRSFDTPRSAAWEVIADFPAIASWNSGVAKSFSTSHASDGPGATRHCDLAPMGELEETIVEWDPEHRMGVRIDSAKKLPIRSGLVTFEVGEQGQPTTITYAYEPRFGPVGRLMGPMIDRQLTRGFEGFLTDWEAAAKRQGTA